MAPRRTRVRHLRDAAVCEDDTPGSRCCSERCVGTVEQRANRRTDQQIEDPQASDVWPRRCRFASRSDVAVAGSQLAPRVNQTPFKCSATSFARDIADPELWTERFHCPTWHDYLRQRSRSTATERALHVRANEFHIGPEPIRIRRMLERPIGSVRWKEDTPDRSTTEVTPITIPGSGP